jgi:hypothetical protein
MQPVPLSAQLFVCCTSQLEIAAKVLRGLVGNREVGGEEEEEEECS